MAVFDGLDGATEGMHWQSSSHGEEAERLREAREASELARLAATTALLLDLVTRSGGVNEDLSALVEDKERLLERLASIVDGAKRQERDLPYRQLVPVRVWRKATEGDDQLRELAEAAPGQIARILSGDVAPTGAEALIARLQLLTRRMHERGNILLAG